MTTNAAIGHFAPMAPTARALLKGGHEVRFGCPASFAATVESAGFVALACDERPVSWKVAPPPAVEHRASRLEWAVTTSWPAEARVWVAALLQQARAWRPEVVVIEPVEHAGRLAAAALGLPLVEHGWGFTLPAGLTRAGSHSLMDLYSDAGSVPAPPALVVDLGAPSIQASDSEPVARYRYLPWSRPGQSLPSPDGRPRVLVTLGTFDNPDAAHRIRAVLRAAHGCDTEVVAVLGNPDRGAGMEFPAGTTVVDWVDLPAAIATCALVIHHGGAGTAWATLAAGLPAVIAPQMGDQFRNATLLTDAGVAISVEPSDLDSPALDRAIKEVLTSPEITWRAARIAAENARLPDLTQLAADIIAMA